MADANENVQLDLLPAELQERIIAFDESLGSSENLFRSLQSQALVSLSEKVSLLDKIKLELVGVYAINSLYWVYLNTKGENPRENGVKQELDRIRSYMTRLKEIEESSKAPPRDISVAKRFLRNALWHTAHRANLQDQTTSKSSGNERSSDMSSKVPIKQTRKLSKMKNISKYKSEDVDKLLKLPTTLVGDS